MIQLTTIPNQNIELEIERYKSFYKKYLSNIKNRVQVLNELYNYIQHYKQLEPTLYFKINNSTEIELDNFIKLNFGNKLFEIFNKDFYRSKELSNNQTELDNLLYDIFISAFNVFKNELDIRKTTWKHRLNILKFTYNCLNDYGLHSNIQKRVNKDFNLIIKHKYNRKVATKEHALFITFEQLNENFISQYKDQLPIKFNGKFIPFNDIVEVQINSTIYKEDEIELLALKNDFKWSSHNKDFSSFIKSTIDVTDKYLPNPYKIILNSSLIDETKYLLTNYPKSLILFTQALNKFEKDNLERNLLDDLRLSLELLLKNILSNEKSLDNQLSDLGLYQQRRNSSSEVTNMFIKLLDYFNKYQNKYIKHNDLVNKNEIELMIDLTTTFIKYLIK